jgi:signal transduction histidine kinase
MESFFASPERKNNEDIISQVNLARSNPVLNTLLRSVGGLLAVLNEDRQILAVNDKLLLMIGLEDAGDLLGLRLGEAVRCVHAEEMPGGCGTSSYCSTCGAAIAIVTSLATAQPVDRTCCLTIEKNDNLIDYYLKVRGITFKITGDRFVLLFLQDVTREHHRSALENLFFHDFNNNVLGLSGLTDMFQYEDKAHLNEFMDKIKYLTGRLKNEVEIQKVVSSQELSTYTLHLCDLSVGEMVRELETLFSSHPAAEGKKLIFADGINDSTLKTDKNLLIRILSNMLVNALEATEVGGQIKFWTEKSDRTIDFCVWNQQGIPENISKRIFQKHFSTKLEPGRGFGTYTMKLFGEHYLNGQVLFSTSGTSGTVFRMRLFR